MNTVIEKQFAALRLGLPQSYGNLSCFPLFVHTASELSYLTLSDALAQGVITVTEVHDAASVPTLKAMNEAALPVLMLDGEELIGAKQNRVLNTSILLGSSTELIIPVSCTEQGRWSYQSARFAPSGMFLPNTTRARKSRSVSTSLREQRGYTSDQRDVWNQINLMLADTKTVSPTRAMRDAYLGREQELEKYLGAYALEEQQVGLLALIHGAPAGMDVFAQPGVYSSYHARLVRSYAIEALRQPKGQEAPPTIEVAHAFLDAAHSCQESCFKSLGLGDDFRYESNKVAGSALVVASEVVHFSFFACAEGA